MNKLYLKIKQMKQKAIDTAKKCGYTIGTGQCGMITKGHFKSRYYSKLMEKAHELMEKNKGVLPGGELKDNISKYIAKFYELEKRKIAELARKVLSELSDAENQFKAGKIETAGLKLIDAVHLFDQLKPEEEKAKNHSKGGDNRQKANTAKHKRILKLWDSMKAKGTRRHEIVIEIAENIYNAKTEPEIMKHRSTIERILRRNNRIK